MTAFQGCSADESHGIQLDTSSVLMIERGKAPGKGLWSVPGGSLETGELVQECALRELAEETGLTGVIPSIGPPNGVFAVTQAIVQQDGSYRMSHEQPLVADTVAFHFVLLHVLACVPMGACPVALDDAAAVGWVPTAAVLSAKPVSGSDTSPEDSFHSLHIESGWASRPCGKEVPSGTVQTVRGLPSVLRAALDHIAKLEEPVAR